MSGAAVVVLLDWLKPEKDSTGDFNPAIMAVKEANAVCVQSLKDAGQMSLLDTAEDLGGQEQ